MNNTPTVKSGYTDNIETGGSIEKTYLSYGSYETASVTVEAEKPMERYTVYYPSNLENGSQTYPVVLVTNGTGHRASKYAARLSVWLHGGSLWSAMKMLPPGREKAPA